MFEFLMDAGNYSSRVVGRNDFVWGFVSTARVSDGRKPFETAVYSEHYGEADDQSKTDSMVIVEAYDTIEAATDGHARWVKAMTESPPAELIDCLNSGIADFLGGEIKQVRLPA